MYIETSGNNLSFYNFEFNNVADWCTKILYSERINHKGFIHQRFEKSNGQMNIILSYFEKNYKAVSEKLNVLIDEEMGGVECGYTKKFEFGIEYTYHNCGEAQP